MRDCSLDVKIYKNEIKPHLLAARIPRMKTPESCSTQSRMNMC
jgi:hypothetical protein